MEPIYTRVNEETARDICSALPGANIVVPVENEHLVYRGRPIKILIFRSEDDERGKNVISWCTHSCDENTCDAIGCGLSKKTNDEFVLTVKEATE